MNCPGSIRLEADIPDPPESSYALEGTLAHECFELFLRNPYKLSAHDREVKKRFGIQIAIHAEKAASDVLKLKPKEADLIVETQVDLSFLHPDLGGTLDAAIADTFGRLQVFDFKYGAGVMVDPEDNPQMLTYALGVLHAYDYDFGDVALTIIQPRIASERGTMRTWITPVEHVREFGAKLQTAARQTEKPNAKLEPGSYCRWCKAAPACPALSTNALRDAQAEFDDVSGELILPAQPVSPDRIGQTLAALEKLDIWSKAIKKEAFRLASRGVEIPGFKLVDKQARRKWTNEAEVSKAARKKWKLKAFETSLKSPAQMRELAGAKWVESHSSLVSSGLTLVPESDRRPAVDPVGLDFDQLPLESETDGE